MPNIYEFPLFADIVRVSCISWLKKPIELQKHLQEYKIDTIYIAPKERLEENMILLKELTIPLQIYPFGGGFKNRSLILCSLQTKEDIAYFTKITNFKEIEIIDTKEKCCVNCNGFNDCKSWIYCEIRNYYDDKFDGDCGECKGCNVFSKRINPSNAGQEYKVNTSVFNNGLYIVNITSAGSKTAIGKFIVKH